VCPGGEEAEAVKVEGVDQPFAFAESAISFIWTLSEYCQLLDQLPLGMRRPGLPHKCQHSLAIEDPNSYPYEMNWPRNRNTELFAYSVEEMVVPVVECYRKVLS